MVDSSVILKAVAVPMSHTPTGILKVEILGGMLVAGVLIATFGFYRWYLIYLEDTLLHEKMIDLIESGVNVNPEDFEPPLRSHFLNYLFMGLGFFLIFGGAVTWLIIPT